MPPLVVLAESDFALRRLMTELLRSVGYDVLESFSALQLRADLSAHVVACAHQVLVISTTSLAEPCREDIALAATARARAGFRPLRVLLTCEADQRGREPPLTDGELLGFLEKPFDIEEFERLARRNLAPLQPSSADAPAS